MKDTELDSNEGRKHLHSQHHPKMEELCPGMYSAESRRTPGWGFCGWSQSPRGGAGLNAPRGSFLPHGYPVSTGGAEGTPGWPKDGVI